MVCIRLGWPTFDGRKKAKEKKTMRKHVKEKTGKNPCRVINRLADVKKNKDLDKKRKKHKGFQREINH